VTGELVADLVEGADREELGMLDPGRFGLGFARGKASGR
jgi:hypothetical protein